MEITNNKKYVYPSLVLADNYFMDSNLAPSKFDYKQYHCNFSDNFKYRIDILGSNGFLDPQNSYIKPHQ